MKKILFAAFALLFTTSLTAQSLARSMKKQEVNGRQIQNDSVTNVAGQRIITSPIETEDGNGVIAKEEGTDAVANSTTSSNKLNENNPRTSNNGKKSTDNATKRLTANGNIPINKNGNSAIVKTNSKQTGSGIAKVGTIQKNGGSTTQGSLKNKKTAKQGLNPENTPIAKPKGHTSKNDNRKSLF